MKKILLLTAEQVLELNKMICSREQQKSHCFDAGKVESALGAAFYPGNPPFQYGGIASMAGALCYFLTKAHAFMDGNKRTAGIAATVLMERNGYDLIYPIEDNFNAFAEIIDQTAANQKNKDQLIKWFETHKIPL